ncbi:MAG: phosphoglycerate kinase [Candidatus Aenigmarchaeota archaeon]|nr:phosphoglycerate kinase [Candidatus Aenigmarchaeota archaeon]
MKTMDDYDFLGKRVLLRVDINSPVVDGKIQDNPRIVAHAMTIKELAEKGAKVIVIAHQGRPGDKDFTNLKQHAKLLENHTGMLVRFVSDITGVANAAESMKKGEIMLLDNVRKMEDEFSEEPENTLLVKTLFRMADVYVNDAFSASHRPHASIVGFKNLLPCIAGRVMEVELSALKNIEESIPPVVLVLGGAKPENSIKLMESRLNYDIALTCGIVGELFLIAKGHDLGKTRTFLTEKGFDKFLVSIKKLETENKKIITPLDVAYDDNGRKEASVLKMPHDKILYDIGSETIGEYRSAIKHAGTVIMNGWAGMAEDKKFRKGTQELLKAVAESEAYSLVCGGHTTEFIEELKIPKSSFSHISIAGGAMLAALAGEKLPGVEALG